jgi:hypothetical protein
MKSSQPGRLQDIHQRYQHRRFTTTEAPMTPIEISQAMSSTFDHAARACVTSCQAHPPSALAIAGMFGAILLVFGGILLCTWWSTRV